MVPRCGARDADFSHDPIIKEEGASLLARLIRASEGMVVPYIKPILKTLITPIKSPNADNAVATCALQAVGELAVVGSELIALHSIRVSLGRSW